MVQMYCCSIDYLVQSDLFFIHSHHLSSIIIFPICENFDAKINGAKTLKHSLTVSEAIQYYCRSKTVMTCTISNLARILNGLIFSICGIVISLFKTSARQDIMHVISVCDV